MREKERVTVRPPRPRPEASRLLTRHQEAAAAAAGGGDAEDAANAWSVRCLVGGVSKVEREAAELARAPPSLLVATPGRLNDHLANGGLARLCGSLRVLVLDEACMGSYRARGGITSGFLASQRLKK